MSDKKLTLNVLTGEFDVYSPENFSYEITELNKTLKIKRTQQMVVADEYILDGTLILEGTIALV